MTRETRERIAFDVETSRLLQILSSEIYDSPKAFLRENVQNAYDAVLMRSAAERTSADDHRIDITVENRRLTVHDNGIGMTEDVLKNNFWKAGSSELFLTPGGMAERKCEYGDCGDDTSDPTYSRKIRRAGLQRSPAGAAGSDRERTT